MTRRVRRAVRRRRALLLVSLLALVVALGVSVRRSARGTRIAAEITDLQRAGRAAEAQAAAEWIRVDSLASRRHVLEAATRLGMRPARENEVLRLPDVTGWEPGRDGR